MKLLKLTTICTLLALLAALSPAAFADPIGPYCTVSGGEQATTPFANGVEKCFGSVITLNYALVSGAGAENEEYQITVTVNTALYPTYTGRTDDYIHSVAAKVSTGLVSGSLASTTAPGAWTYQAGGSNASGCDGSGAGWFCAQDGTAALANGSTYSWVFDVFLASGALNTAQLGSSVKIEYDKKGGSNAGISSVDITAQHPSVPEPSALLLFGTVAGLIGWRCRARRVSS
jgi:hypothetical protein